MILVDTSVWIHHFRQTEPRLSTALERGEVMTHPHVIGELACGHLRNRREILGLLADLPGSPEVTHGEALHFIERHRLMGRGIGLIDVHLLASAALAGSALLWTRDKRLGTIAKSLKLGLS